MYALLPHLSHFLRRLPEVFRQRSGYFERDTVYGQTELSPIVTQTSPSDSPEEKAETAGRPLDHVEVKVVDPTTNRTLGCGETGIVRGAAHAGRLRPT